jgi:hypothetical protein
MHLMWLVIIPKKKVPCYALSGSADNNLTSKLMHSIRSRTLDQNWKITGVAEMSHLLHLTEFFR